LNKREADDPLGARVFLDLEVRRRQPGDEVAVLVEHANVDFNDLRAGLESRLLRLRRRSALGSRCLLTGSRAGQHTNRR
jgi:hypothetical protein